VIPFHGTAVSIKILLISKKGNYTALRGLSLSKLGFAFDKLRLHLDGYKKYTVNSEQYTVIDEPTN
jgi:hypothetical protein